MIDKIDNEWTKTPVCPHCGEEDKDWWDGTEMRDDGDSELNECGNCEGEYRTTMSVDVEFCTEPILRDNAQADSSQHEA